MLHYTRVERLAGDIRSNLLRPLEYYEENEVLRNVNTTPGYIANEAAPIL
jgi:hypothetical protein